MAGPGKDGDRHARDSAVICNDPSAGTCRHPPASKDPNTPAGRPNPPTSVLRALDERVSAGLSLLGLTPADRSRYGFSEASGIDALDEFRARGAARRA
jgi:hypothetical protein